MRLGHCLGRARGFNSKLFLSETPGEKGNDYLFSESVTLAL